MQHPKENIQNDSYDMYGVTSTTFNDSIVYNYTHLKRFYRLPFEQTNKTNDEKNLV